MQIELREKRVGPFTVRELPMRETMRIMEAYPGEGNKDRGPALLGAAVFNGSAEPVGPSVLDFGTGLYQRLMAAFNEVNAAPVFEADAEGNV